MDEKRLNLVSGMIVDSAYRIHSRLGPGLFESAYCKLLAADLVRRELNVETEKSISFEYDGIEIHDAYRVDMFVEGTILVEVKSVQKLHGDPRKADADLHAPDRRSARPDVQLQFVIAKDGIKRYIISPQPASK